MFFNMVENNYKLAETDEDRQGVSIIIILFLMFYISSGIFTQIEGTDLIYLDYTYFIKEGNDPDDYDLDSIAISLNFHTSVYFVIVTLLTIGYGEITPTSNRGMIVVVMLMVFTVVLIPQQTSELLRLKAL